MFDDAAIFPLELSQLGASPSWSTTVVKMGGGNEQRNQNWTDALRLFNATTGIRTLVDLQTLHRHYNGRRGPTRGFPLLDRTGYTRTTEPFGTGNGSATAFQLILNDGDSVNAYNRNITKPKQTTIQIYIGGALKTEGVDYTISYTTGVVTFTAAPANGAALTWSGQFYVPVRYVPDAFPDHKLFVFRPNGTGLVQGPDILMQEIRDFT